METKKFSAGVILAVLVFALFGCAQKQIESSIDQTLQLPLAQTHVLVLAPCTWTADYLPDPECSPGDVLSTALDKI